MPIHEIDGVEIFSTGIHNDDKYTESDLDELVRNFETMKGTVKPMLKLGHDESKWKDGLPAIGWIKGLKRVGGKLFADFKEVPKLVYDLIKSGRYKRVSSEIYWNTKNKGQNIGKVLAGVALLGADVPSIKDLADLTAYLTEKSDKGSFERKAVYFFEVNQNKIVFTEAPGLIREFEIKIL